MNTTFFELPSEKDWKRISKTSPFSEIYHDLQTLELSILTGDTLDDFVKVLELGNLSYELKQRLNDVHRSYILTMFYYEKGIPDKRWYVSPGKNGASIEYFPDFDEMHFHIKGWFDFYSDTLYYKLFSAWDLIGHILKVHYNLVIEEEKIYFTTAVKQLKSKDETLHKYLEGHKNSPVFKKARKIRVDITHNYLPHTAYMTVHKEERSKTIRLKEYIPSDEIVANINDSLVLFGETLNALCCQFHKSPTPSV